MEQGFSYYLSGLNDPGNVSDLNAGALRLVRCRL